MKYDYGRKRNVYDWPSLVHKCVSSLNEKNQKYLTKFLVQYYKTGDILGGKLINVSEGIKAHSDEGKVIAQSCLKLLTAKVAQFATEEQKKNIPERLFNWGTLAVCSSIQGFLQEACRQAFIPATPDEGRLASSRIWVKVIGLEGFLKAFKKNVSELVRFAQAAKVTKIVEDKTHAILLHYNMNPRSVMEDKYFRQNNGKLDSNMRDTLRAIVMTMDENSKELGFKASLPKVTNAFDLLDPVAGLFRMWNSHVNTKLIVLKRMLTGSKGGMEKVDWSSSKDESLLQETKLAVITIV